MYVDGACNARHSECVVTLVCAISVVNVAKIHLCSFQPLASLYIHYGSGSLTLSAGSLSFCIYMYMYCRNNAHSQHSLILSCLGTAATQRMGIVVHVYTCTTEGTFMHVYTCMNVPSVDGK